MGVYKPLVQLNFLAMDDVEDVADQNTFAAISPLFFKIKLQRIASWLSLANAK